MCMMHVWVSAGSETLWVIAVGIQMRVKRNLRTRSIGIMICTLYQGSQNATISMLRWAQQKENPMEAGWWKGPRNQRKFSNNLDLNAMPYKELWMEWSRLCSPWTKRKNRQGFSKYTWEPYFWHDWCWQCSCSWIQRPCCVARNRSSFSK